MDDEDEARDIGGRESGDASEGEERGAEASGGDWREMFKEITPLIARLSEWPPATWANS